MLLPTGEASGKGALYSLGRRSLAMFPELVAELHTRTGIDPEFVASGAIHVATTERRAKTLRAKTSAFAADGVCWPPAAALRPVEPQPCQHVLGATLSPSDGHLRTRLLVPSLPAAPAPSAARLRFRLSARGLRRNALRL